MITQDTNQFGLIIISIVRLFYGIWSWIKPSLILPSHTINHTKKYILIISKTLVIGSSILLPLHLQYSTINNNVNNIAFTPTFIVLDQSRSMAHNDLSPSRRDLALHIKDRIYSAEISDTPFNNLSRGGDNTMIITYAQVPHINKLKDINSLKPITTQAGSSALGDARLIAYDQIGSGLDHKPIIITITDGGSNTGYDLSQTSTILKTRAQLRIIGLSTGTQIIAYDDDGRGLTSTMDSALLSSLADSGHRYPIPDDTSLSGVIDRLGQDLHNQYYRLPPSAFSFQLMLWILLGLGILGWGGIYLTRKPIFNLP